MNKLVLAFLLLSSCEQMTARNGRPHDDVVVCAFGALENENESEHYLYSIEASVERSRLSTQVKITLNAEVMLDTCDVTSADGFTAYPYDESMWLQFDLRKNAAWRNMYVDEDGQPARSDIDLKIETRARCQDAWREVIPETRTSLEWRETGGGCLPPGYRGAITVPLGS